MTTTISKKRQGPTLVFALALVGIAAVAALVLARPEPIPATLAPPPRSALSTAPMPPETAGPEEHAQADPASEAEAPEEPAHGYALTRQDFEAAITRVRNPALGCKDESAPPMMKVKIMIAPTGAVTSVSVPEELRGTRVGDCVARAMRSATFPPYRFPLVPQVEWTYTLRFSGTD